MTPAPTSSSPISVKYHQKSNLLYTSFKKRIIVALSEIRKRALTISWIPLAECRRSNNPRLSFRFQTYCKNRCLVNLIRHYAKSKIQCAQTKHSGQRTTRWLQRLLP